MLRISNYFKLVSLFLKGVKLKSFFSIEIQGDIKVGSNVTIEKDVVLQGNVELLDGVIVSRNCFIKDSRIGLDCHVRSFSIIEGADIGSKSFIGPFARLRPKTKLGKKSQIGNFVEIKNSEIGSSCRINHMAFVGDATIGDRVTIGAGTITCNHDGENVQQTVIESGAYIGSNVNLVAPIKILKNSTIGSGSTITENTSEGKLTLARVRQSTIENWQGPKSGNKE